SGKTTVMKQMQILHTGFTIAQREFYRQQVFSNLYDSIRACLVVMSDEEIELKDEKLLESVSLFVSPVKLESGQPFPNNYLEPLKRLWLDEGLRKVTSRYYSAIPANFFGHLNRLFSPSYIPTDQDILECRGKTIGVNEMIFNVSNLRYRMVDVGGQRSERRKWIHCFEHVIAIIFLVAISGYDSVLEEDEDVNQIRESLMVFDSIINSKWFSKTSMMLFMNKTDLFKKKLAISPISLHFPDYPGSDTDFEAGQLYFSNEFVSLNKSSQREIYIHVSTVPRVRPTNLP
ncbi:hypothetical protein CROQUDRAFT_658450, partial [Cronartium quercuum f. sp. fusiforme G11]